MKTIRVGIFGGKRGSNFIEPILACNAGVAAVCDRDEGIRHRAAAWAGDRVAEYADFDAFLDHPMDAVILANDFHQHAPYAIRCLQRGLHVLCECGACGTLAEGAALVRAAEKSSAVFMLAENYAYMKFSQEIARVCREGSLGRPLYLEGEYTHPLPPDIATVIDLRPREDHWRNWLPRSYYITHSLSPLVRATGVMPVRVVALPVFAPMGERWSHGSRVGDAAAILLCQNDDGSVTRLTGCAAFGAHEYSYRICGEKGQIETPRGMGGRLMLRYNAWDVPDGLMPETLYTPVWPDGDGTLAETTGHDGSDFYVIRHFLRHVEQGSRPFFDAVRAVTMAAVGIMAHRSLLAGGQPQDIPDFTREEVRLRLDGDTLTPFPGEDGRPPTMPCCSVPDYAPTPDQLERYRQALSHGPS